MPIHFNGSGMKEIFFGSQPIAEVYKGGDLVWAKNNRPNVDVMLGYARFNSWTTFEQGATNNVSELGKTWTVVAPVPPGTNVGIGGVTFWNDNGNVWVRAESNRGKLEYKSPQTHSGVPLVMLCAGTDYYGYRTRMYVDGVSVESATNGGPLKLGESTKGGFVYVNTPWAAYWPRNALQDVNSNIPNDICQQAVRYGAVLFRNLLQDPGSSNVGTRSFPGVSDFRWGTFYRGMGGSAQNSSLKRGGTAGPQGFIRHEYGQSLSVSLRNDGGLTINGREFSAGKDSGMPGVNGEQLPEYTLPWGEKISQTVASSNSTERPGSGGTYYEPQSGSWDYRTIAGASQCRVYLTT